METIDAAFVAVVAEALAEALADLTKVAPINVLESRGSSYSEYSPTKSWIVLYPKGPTYLEVSRSSEFVFLRTFYHNGQEFPSAEDALADITNDHALYSLDAEFALQLIMSRKDTSPATPRQLTNALRIVRTVTGLIQRTPWNAYYGLERTTPLL
ncbi:hypothetical protein K3495_g15186 [Podosphaera aphanis]|nr:hypothetical protein K3495_g15186 [Podosphaera aphanis]